MFCDENIEIEPMAVIDPMSAENIQLYSKSLRDIRDKTVIHTTHVVPDTCESCEASSLTVKEKKTGIVWFQNNVVWVVVSGSSSENVNGSITSGTFLIAFGVETSLETVYASMRFSS